MDKPQIFKRRPALSKKIAVVRSYESALRELFFVRNPGLKNSPVSGSLLKKFLRKPGISPVWIHLPWLNCVVETVPESVYFELRTARNRLAITEKEQRRFRACSVAIAGLSVGSGILRSLVVSGGPQRIRIADFDRLEITNLNRIASTIAELGQNKAVVAARHVWELDPFADITVFSDGITEKNLVQFLLRPKVDVFVDEMDSLEMKVLSRMLCKKHGIPVFMATDNGDGIILDVERFDTQPSRPLFHGLLGKVSPEDFKNISYAEWLKRATAIVGPEYLTPRMRQSILEIGKTVAGVPQLGTTAAMAGAAVCYAIRKLSSGDALPSGRYICSLEQTFGENKGGLSSLKKKSKPNND